MDDEYGDWKRRAKIAKLVKRFSEDEDAVICPVCQQAAIGFHNYCYFDAYTVRCKNCNKEFDYATYKHFIDNPKTTLHETL